MKGKFEIEGPLVLFKPDKPYIEADDLAAIASGKKEVKDIQKRFPVNNRVSDLYKLGPGIYGFIWIRDPGLSNLRFRFKDGQGCEGTIYNGKAIINKIIE